MLLSHARDLDIGSALESFAQVGYARLGRVLDDEGLRALRERAEDLMLGRVSYPGLFFQLDATTGKYEDAPLRLGWQGPSLAYRKLEKLEKDPVFRAWLNNPLFERVARARIAGDVALYRAIVFNKAAAGGSNVPWHQDGGALWGLSSPPTLQRTAAASSSFPAATGRVWPRRSAASFRRRRSRKRRPSGARWPCRSRLERAS